MSAGVATLQIVANIIVAIISIVSNWNQYILELWLGRIIGIVLNVALVIVGYKYPKQTAPYHGALLVLNQLCLLLWKTEHDLSNFPKNAMPASIAGLCNTMMYGLVTNGNWMLNACCMILVIMITLTYYSIMFAYIDIVTISLLSNTIIFITIALYTIEKKDKMEFLAYKQIMQMNEELKSILMNLPEGIVLIDEETNKVSLNN